MLLTIIKALIMFIDLVMIFIMTKVMHENEEFDPLHAKLVSLFMICVWGADLVIIWSTI